MDTNLTAEEASDVAAHKAKSAQLAVEVARELQQNDLVEKTAQRVLEGLTKVFSNDNEKDPKEMRVVNQRVPILCVNVDRMHTDIKDLKELMTTNNGDHEVRIRLMEKNMWKFFGILLIVPPVVTLGIAFIISRFAK